MPGPSLDPQVRGILERLVPMSVPLDSLSVAEARAASVARRALLVREREPVERLNDVTIPGPGGALAARLYARDGDRLPVLVYFHGGGWVLGDLDSADPLCRALANAARCIVVSVAYPLAPEHRFPVPLEAAHAATRWIARHAGELGADDGRVAVGGDSAGGNLAAAVALVARDRGGPAICHQALLVPVMDRDFETPSYRENGDGYLLTRADMAWYWRQYLPSDADARHPYASPLRAPELRGLPPATVVTAEFDPLRDEGEAYAARLRDAGVAVESRRYAGMIHGFIGMAGEVDAGKRAIADVAAALRRAFARR